MKRLLARVSLMVVSATLSIAAQDGPPSEWEPFTRGQRAYDAGDWATALRQLRPLAEQGDGRALYLVGSMFFEGKGVQQNKRTASILFRYAANAGSADAEFRLAMMYITGDGIRENRDDFIYYLRRAAEHGVPSAQYGMGGLYYVGVKATPEFATEIPQDPVVAYMWFNLCAEEEDKCAIKLKHLSKEMTPPQIHDATDASERWKSEHRQDGVK